MVVKYKLILVVFVSWLLASNVSCATEPKDIEIVQLATTNYKKALADYEKQLGYCADETDKNRIDSSIFKDIKLTQLQLQIAIGHFHFKALDKCESEKFGVFLVNRGIYRETLKEFKVKFDSDNPVYYDDSMLFGIRYRHIKAELKYLSYPKSERDKLENMPELKNMFHLFSAIDN